MKILSYLKKFWLLANSRTMYKKNQISANLYAFNFVSGNKIEQVVFALNDAEYMHLGDYLFLLPVIKNFIDNGYQVAICATPSTREFLKRLNFPVVETVDYALNNTLIISRFEMIPQYKRYQSIFIHVSQDLTMPICSQLLMEFSALFNFKCYQAINYGMLANSAILNQLNLPAKQKLIIFNPYCDAAAYLITRAKRERIINQVLMMLKQIPDAKVVLTGTAQEKKHDLRQYPFSYIDLRGKSSVVDIFALVLCENVISYVGFDSFIMHVFSLCGKSSYVVFRGRITAKQEQMLSRFHVNLFCGDHFVTLI